MKPPAGHRFLDPEEVAEDAALDRAAEAIVNRAFTRLFRAYRAAPARREEPNADAAVRAFLEAWDRESR